MTPKQELELLRLLGLAPSDFEDIRRSPNEAAARVKLDAIKVKAKAGFRKAARELHPDATGGDAEKTEMFKMLAPLVERIEKMELKVRRPPMTMPFVPGWVMGAYSGGMHGTTSSSSVNGSIQFGGATIVFQNGTFSIKVG